ncbi:hypothetical protein [Marinomonas gallaica]|uniref:hypothetical protein n=1 Tax=Marinomonas gallaica TaxID=1806667 RepID=UPI00082C4D23|nr:hypothetical protein [Marinomonas gallaica]
MKKLIAITSAVLATSAITSPAFADNISDDLRMAEARYESMATEIESEGYQVDSLYTESMTTSQKLDTVKEKNMELKGVLNSLETSQ